MPHLNRDVIRGWLADHNWRIPRLAAEYRKVDPDDPISPEVLRGAVNGYDPMREGRIKVLVRVTELYGDPIPYGRLAVGEKKEEVEGPKEEPIAPPRRTDKSGSGPKRVHGSAA